MNAGDKVIIRSTCELATRTIVVVDSGRDGSGQMVSSTGPTHFTSEVKLAKRYACWSAAVDDLDSLRDRFAGHKFSVRAVKGGVR